MNQSFRLNLMRVAAVWLFFGIIAVATVMSDEAKKEIGPRPQDIHIADVRKSGVYMRDGVFVGGDPIVKTISFRNLRHSIGDKYERMVLDIIGNESGMPAQLTRPPYYQVAMEPEQKRIMVTIYGEVSIDAKESEIIKGLKKSKSIKSVNLLPRLERDRWSFVIETRGDRPIEVFELSQPTRIVVDIKR